MSRYTVYWRHDDYWVVRDNDRERRFVSKYKGLGFALQAAAKMNQENKVLTFHKKKLTQKP